MKTNTSLVAKNVRLQQWVQEIHECNSRPKGMSVDEWCNERGLKKILTTGIFVKYGKPALIFYIFRVGVLLCPR